MPAIKLTPKQRVFVDQYVLCRSGAEAARRAGYSEKTAHQIAYENLRKPEVIAYLTVREAELARITAIDRNRVVKELLGGIDMAKQNMNGGQIISGWVHVARLLGLDKPETKPAVANASSKDLEARMALLSDAELTEIAAGRVTI